MHVNSVFKGFFNNGLAVGSSIAIVILFSISVASASGHRYGESRVHTTTGAGAELPSGPEPSDRESRAKQVNLIIREMGHRLLLQAGDSTSRVLPVTETEEGRFQLRFENEFVFNHDSLMALSLGMLPKTLFPSGYTVTVHDCMDADIVYGFQLNNTLSDILPCRGRSQPPGCYIIEFDFPDFYENAEQKKADIGPLAEGSKPSKGNPLKASRKPEKVKPTTFDSDVDQPTEELRSFKADPQETNTTLNEFKPTTSSGYSLANLIYSGALVVFGVSLLIVRFGKILTPAPVQNQNYATIKESVPELAALGKFLFDVKGQRLLSENEVISLTDKECKILELLNADFGELIPRETLMQKIWINEGVITGRSLDMFVSKLRKKLSGDPDLRITNVHGKGYKLEIPGTL